jgi:Uma2 family endonuclease
VLANLNVEQEFGHVFINGVLITHERAQVSNNPDAVAVRYETIERGRVRFITHQDRELVIDGSPDWVLEIVSDSTVIKDTRTLREAYHLAGIREYWIIDARGPEMVFQILHRRKHGYSTAPSKEGWLRSRVFGCSFHLSRRRDRRGAWRYSLAVR